MSNNVVIIGDWEDSLIWCPSQCELKLSTNDGSNYILYLRWRWSNPWTASLIPLDSEFSIDNSKDWIRLEIPFFRDDQIDNCKKASLEIALKRLNG